EMPEVEIVVDPNMVESADDQVVFAESQEVTCALPIYVIAEDHAANEARLSGGTYFDDEDASSLHHLVAQQSISDNLSEEMQCLAGTVYFESKGETLAGQLAVARVVLARAESRSEERRV